MLPVHNFWAGVPHELILSEEPGLTEPTHNLNTIDETKNIVVSVSKPILWGFAAALRASFQKRSPFPLLGSFNCYPKN